MERAKKLLEKFATPDLLVSRAFNTGGKAGNIIYNPDLTDSVLAVELMRALESVKRAPKTAEELVEKIICVAESQVESDEQKLIDGVLSGDAALYVEGCDGITVNMRKYATRAVAEPPTATVMRGPREGFIEDLKTNLSLLERRLKSPNFAVERIKIGRVSNTNVAIVYLSNIADLSLVLSVKQRLESADIDAIIDSHHIQPLLEERPNSFFHQTGISEKPDVIEGKLLEGRVAVIVDGSPMVVTVPFLFIEDYQSGEDYYERASLATFLRVLRIISLFFAILLPGLYVALQEFHYSIIPLRFLITVMTSVNGIPLTPIAELLFVILLFEIIREASVRMPRAVGMAMSIVGALVLGDTAVKAGIISSPAVMITALSSIALYVAPNQEGTMTLLRFVFTLLGGLGGLYMLMLGSLYLVLYLATLNGYGVPYLAPLMPLIPSDLKDALYRTSILRMDKRPVSLGQKNKTRQGVNGSGK